MRGWVLWVVIAWSVLAAIIIERRVPGAGLAATVAGASLIGLFLAAASVLGRVLWRGLTEPAPMLSLPDGERPVASAAARHTPAGGVPRGGRLFITTAALRFVPRALSFDRDLAMIPFSSIVRVEARGEHAVRIHTSSSASSLVVVDEAPLLALWLTDLCRGDRGVRAVLDIAAFSPESEERSVLTL